MDYGVYAILQARILEWVAFPISRGSSQSRDLTQVSCIAGGFFPAEPQGKPKNTGVGPIPSPADLLNPGIEPGSPALLADSLPTELWGKPKFRSSFLLHYPNPSWLCTPGFPFCLHVIWFLYPQCYHSALGFCSWWSLLIFIHIPSNIQPTSNISSKPRSNITSSMKASMSPEGRS